MSTQLPIDANNTPIPALRLKSNGAHSVNSATGSSTRNGAAFDADTQIVSIYATEAVYIKFGGNSVEATSSDHYFPAGVYYDLSIGGDTVKHSTHCAVRGVDTAGTVYISEKQ